MCIVSYTIEFPTHSVSLRLLYSHQNIISDPFLHQSQAYSGVFARQSENFKKHKGRSSYYSAEKKSLLINHKKKVLIIYFYVIFLRATYFTLIFTSKYFAEEICL